MIMESLKVEYPEGPPEVPQPKGPPELIPERRPDRRYGTPLSQILGATGLYEDRDTGAERHTITPSPERSDIVTRRRRAYVQMQK